VSRADFVAGGIDVAAFVLVRNPERRQRSMAYDEYRETRRLGRDEEYGREEFGRSDYGRRTPFGRDEESRWPGESSWGYGREYDEGYPERFRSGEIRSFESEAGPRMTRGATEAHPGTTSRYRADFGWQPEGGYGQGLGYLYGWSPGAQGFESMSYRTPERWRQRFTTSETRDEPRFYYGSSRHLARIPRGRFTGRGPKGYQRSDERIREDVNEELWQSGEIDASEIMVQVTNGVVTLDGDVETREQKSLAEDIAEIAPGVREVHNNLHVKKGFFARLFGTDKERDEDRVESR
jgi:hypothetical protein